jgi:membrane protease YdiL (CAAX protease family)
MMPTTVAAPVPRVSLATVAFFALAYALSWAPSVWEAHSILPLGPLFAALVMLAVTGGWASVRHFLQRIVRWRVKPHWYLLVLGLPVALTAIAVWSNVLFGAAAPSWERVPPLAALPGMFLFIMLFIGLGEEPAWRGYALPRLTAGRSALSGSLLLGVLHAVWHLPLFGLEYDLQNAPPWLVSLLGFTIVSTWLVNRTGGSLLLPVLFHTSVNVTAKYLFIPLFDGTDTLRLWWLVGGLWALVALGVVAIYGRDLGRVDAERNRRGNHLATRRDGRLPWWLREARRRYERSGVRKTGEAATRASSATAYPDDRWPGRPTGLARD